MIVYWLANSRLHQVTLICRALVKKGTWFFFIPSFLFFYLSCAIWEKKERIFFAFIFPYTRSAYCVRSQLSGWRAIGVRRYFPRENVQWPVSGCSRSAWAFGIFASHAGTLLRAINYFMRRFFSFFFRRWKALVSHLPAEVGVLRVGPTKDVPACTGSPSTGRFVAMIFIDRF